MIDFTKEVIVLLAFILAITVLCFVVRDKKKSDIEISSSEKDTDDVKSPSNNKKEK